MKFHSFLIKYGEIGIKGKNRYIFEDALVRQIRYALQGADGEFLVHKCHGRVYVDCEGEYDFEETVESLKKVFGIVGICPVVRVPVAELEQLKKDVVSYVDQVYEDKNLTFKVEARRANKRYPVNSMEINCAVGEAVLEAFPETKVDVHDPDVRLNVEIREEVYIYSKIIPGPGGMPIGTNGSAMLLLSGGIDSPVAGYMIAKRGVEIEATYFHAPPYTSERAKEKVVDLARLVSAYAGPIKLHVVNFTDIQLAIYEKCPHDELTIIMRRYMMKIAEHFAKKDGCLGLITGESIGQVASQTMQSLNATNAVCTLLVYRPLIGFDKKEIVEISEKINTYETSIQPFEDCCTIFVAKHPVTKPNLERIEKSELNLTDVIDDLMKTAIDFARLPAYRGEEKETAERIKALRNEAKDTIKKLQEAIFAYSPEMQADLVRRMYPVAQGLARLTKLFLDAFAAAKREKNMIDFHDYEHFALEILMNEDGTPTEAAAELRQRYDEIMIDEYQDSTLEQETILAAVSGESIGENNRFMVGDVKQSIYRFRQAMPELFNEKYQRYPAEEGQKERKIVLSKNFRSRKNILDGVNFIFRQIMQKEFGDIAYDDAAALYAGMTFPDCAEPHGGENEILLIATAETEDSELSEELKELDRRQVEATAIAARIRALMESGYQVVDKKTGAYRPLRYGDIAILLRSMKNWSSVLDDVFGKAGMPPHICQFCLL